MLAGFRLGTRGGELRLLSGGNLRETGWVKLESEKTELTSKTSIRDKYWVKQDCGNDECWVFSGTGYYVLGSAEVLLDVEWY